MIAEITTTSAPRNEERIIGLKKAAGGANKQAREKSSTGFRTGSRGVAAQPAPNRQPSRSALRCVVVVGRGDRGDENAKWGSRIHAPSNPSSHSRLRVHKCPELTYAHYRGSGSRSICSRSIQYGTGTSVDMFGAERYGDMCRSFKRKRYGEHPGADYLLSE
jgi:hypothetical protein